MTFWYESESANLYHRPDPDLRIRTTERFQIRIRIQIRIPILLFSSVAVKMPTKKKYFLSFFPLFLFEGTFTSALHRHKIKTVFRIHDILVWIRIRIRGSMPLTNGSGSCYFRHRSSRCQQKTNFLFYFSAYYFLKIHLQR